VSTVDLLSIQLSSKWGRVLPVMPVRCLQGLPWSQAVVLRTGELWPPYHGAMRRPADGFSLSLWTLRQRQVWWSTLCRALTVGRSSSPSTVPAHHHVGDRGRTAFRRQRGRRGRLSTATRPSSDAKSSCPPKASRRTSTGSGYVAGPGNCYEPAAPAGTDRTTGPIGLAQHVIEMPPTPGPRKGCVLAGQQAGEGSFGVSCVVPEGFGDVGPAGEA
jgi:hypothetical protein